MITSLRDSSLESKIYIIITKMQDSLADFIGISENRRKQEEVKPNEEAVLTAEGKQQYNERAMKIVEFSVEGKLHPEVFLKCLPYINKSHYQDIVEERAIAKLCGYPVCGRRLPQMPSKQYHISAKSNKVYDITDRKNYCSNFCYKAGVHIKKQIDTSPLWLRKFEDISKFKLLPFSDRGFPGEEIYQGTAKKNSEASFTSILAFTEVSLGDVINNEVSRKSMDNNSKSNLTKEFLLNSCMETIKENCGGENIQQKDIIKSGKSITNEISTTKHKLNDSHKEITFENKMKLKKAKLGKSTEEKSPKISLITTDIESHMKKCLKEWFTLETHMFIFGKAKIKESISEEKLAKLFENLNLNENQCVYRKRYIEICRQLHLKAIADEKFDRRLFGNASLEPLPDYQELKRENKILDFKVKSFYGGMFYEAEDSNISLNHMQKTHNDNEDGPPAVLPLVDTKSHITLRRQIFLTSAKKAMQKLLQKLRLPSLAIISDLQALIKTFDLKADNIVFKPRTWNYISVALLKMLSLKNREMFGSLEAEKGALEYMDAVLNDLPSKTKFVDYVVDLAKDSNVLIEKYLEFTEKRT